MIYSFKKKYSLKLWQIQSNSSGQSSKELCKNPKLAPEAASLVFECKWLVISPDREMMAVYSILLLMQWDQKKTMLEDRSRLTTFVCWIWAFGKNMASLQNIHLTAKWTWTERALKRSNPPSSQADATCFVRCCWQNEQEIRAGALLQRQNALSDVVGSSNDGLSCHGPT